MINILVHFVATPLHPAVAEAMKTAADAALQRAERVAYIAGCLNLHTREVEALIVERNADVGAVYERLQMTQYYGRCDLSIDYLFGVKGSTQ